MVIQVKMFMTKSEMKLENPACFDLIGFSDHVLLQYSIFKKWFMIIRNWQDEQPLWLRLFRENSMKMMRIHWPLRREREWRRTTKRWSKKSKSLFWKYRSFYYNKNAFFECLLLVVVSFVLFCFHDFDGGWTPFIHWCWVERDLNLRIHLNFITNIQ